MTDTLPPLLPTLDGKVQGIVNDRPWTLQCYDCRSTITNATLPEHARSARLAERDSIAYLVIQSGYHFHRCNGVAGPRRCPDCLQKVMAACPSPACRTRAEGTTATVVR